MKNGQEGKGVSTDFEDSGRHSDFLDVKEANDTEVSDLDYKRQILQPFSGEQESCFNIKAPNLISGR